MAIVYDGHFEGVHFVEKSHLLSDNTITLSAEDFKLITDYILELEYKLFLATGEHTKSIKEY